MRSLYIPLPEGTAARLRTLAERELRDPKAMAAWLILDGLRRAGLPVELEPREQAELRNPTKATR